MTVSVPRRVRLVSRVMRGVCIAAALALPVAAAAAAADHEVLTGFPAPDGVGPVWIAVVLSGLVLALPMVVVGRGLFRLSRAFGDYARGAVFTQPNADRLRSLGNALLICAALQPVAHMLAVLILTVGNPPGQRLLQISIGSDELILAAMGAGIAVVGWVMAEAVRLAADAEQIV